MNRLSDHEFIAFRTQTFAQLRRASDDVRTRFIPSFDPSKLSARSAYFSMNSRYFEEDVLLGQMMLRDDVAKYSSDGVDDSHYKSDIEELRGLRTGRGNAGGFEVLHPRFVKIIAERFFGLLDSASIPTAQQFSSRFLAIADFIFQIAHFSKDGSGRTGEDALALFGAQLGMPLTFSLTGYRAALGGPEHLIFFRHLTERMGQIELVRNFFRALGIKPPLNTPVHIQEVLKTVLALQNEQRIAPLAWPGRMRAKIDEILESFLLTGKETESEFSPNHPYRLYASFMVKELVYLTLCLENVEHHYEELCARYPLSLACREQDILDASLQTYRPIPAPVCDRADEAVSRLDVLRHSPETTSDAEFTQCVNALRKESTDLAELFDSERRTASLETLLTRVKVPIKETMSAREIREVVSNQIDWSLVSVAGSA